MTITGLMAGLALAGGLFISVNSGINIGPAVFSSVSAIATCGLSIAETAQLHIASQILIMLFMFFGRVGGLTLIYAALPSSGSSKSRQPLEDISIG